MDAISEISSRLRKGSTIAQVQAAFEAHEFPALERKTSQMALLAAVERASTDTLNVQEIVDVVPQVQQPTISEDKDNETTTKEESAEISKEKQVETRKKSLAQIGLTAFMTAVQKEPERADEIISTLHLEDFSPMHAEKQYAKLVLETGSELDIAQVHFYPPSQKIMFDEKFFLFYLKKV